jgi:hypothetical protein
MVATKKTTATAGTKPSEAANKKQTRPSAASAASKVLTSVKSTPADKKAAGSALSQTAAKAKKPATAKK